MTLRLGTKDDTDYILAKAKQFHTQSPYRDVPFDERAALDTLYDALENGVVVLSENGLLIGLIIKPHFSAATVAVEIVRWSTPERARDKILEESILHDAFEFWAKRCGADFIQDAAFHDTNYFLKRDYTPAEQIYIKRL